MLFPKKMLLLIPLIAYAIIGFSQTTDVSSIVLPPSPTASSLGKYGELPVNYFTGSVNLSVPIYEVKLNSLSLPIRLSYNSGGIKVSEVASWVGLGFTLEAGGVITKTVNGMPDEDFNGYYQILTSITPEDINNIAGMADDQYLNLHYAATGQADTEPDMYSYNFNGKSGKWMYNPMREIVKMPYSSIDIRQTGNQNSPFEIITLDGVKYTFSSVETSAASYSSGSNSNSYTSSWFLTKMEAPNGEVIDFYYGAPTEVSYAAQQSETDFFYLDFTSVPPKDNISVQRYYTPKLLRIETRNETIFFERETTQRNDLAGDFALKSIRVFDKVDQTDKKQFDFTYEYASRLHLKSITERAPGTSETFKKHSFKYNATILPPTNSFDQDHWGYYNAKGNATLKPYVSIFPISYPKGNRTTDPNYAGAESLQEVHYPTGGYTKFDFASHRASEALVVFDSLFNMGVGVEHGQPQGTEVNSGIFRIRAKEYQTIKIYGFYNYVAPDGFGCFIYLYKVGVQNPIWGISPTMDDYVHDGGAFSSYDIPLDTGRYFLIAGNGSGGGGEINCGFTYYDRFKLNKSQYFGGQKLVGMGDFSPTGALLTYKKFSYSDAVLLSPVDETHYYYQNNIVTDIDCDGNSDIGTPHTGWARTARSNVGFADTHVCYENVTVEAQDEDGYSQGKTVYTFSIAGDEGAFTYPFGPRTSYSYLRGNLLKETVYDKNGDVKKTTINTYQYQQMKTSRTFKAGYKTQNPCYNGFNKMPSLFVFNIADFHSVWTKLSTTEVIVDGVSQKSFLYYDNPVHQQLTRKEIQTGPDEKQHQFILYAMDYPTGTGFIDNMITKRIWTLPIETISGVSNLNGSDLRILAGTSTKYSTAYPLSPSQIYALEFDRPVEKANFKFSNRQVGVLPSEGNQQSYSISTDYKIKTTYSDYGAFGTLLQYQDENNYQNTVKWAYNNSHPVLHIVNANRNEYFFQDFEEFTSGAVDTTKVHTGKKSYNGPYTISFTTPNSRNYILTYWKLTGSTWTLVRQPYSGTSVTLNEGTPIDNILIRPKTSEIKSYTKDRFGIRSISDGNNQPVFFDYDNNGFLHLIKDKNKNILQQLNYYYANN